MIDGKELLSYADAHPDLIRRIQHPRGDLVKLDYTQKVPKTKEWNPFTEAARGIILRFGGEIVAFPFSRMQAIHSLAELPAGGKWWATEKLDGSLVIPYRDPGGEARPSTRGSFESNEVRAAERVVESSGLKLDTLDLDRFSYMFELIAPEVRIVTEYGDREELVLIGVRDLKSGLFLDPPKLTTKAQDEGLAHFGIFEGSHEALRKAREGPSETNEEGWVIHTEAGGLFKFKRQMYLDHIAVRRGMSRKKIVEHVVKGTYGEWVFTLSDEKAGFAEDVAQPLFAEIERLIDEVGKVLEETKALTGKELATVLYRDHKDIAGLVFSVKNGQRSIRDAVMKSIRQRAKKM